MPTGTRAARPATNPRPRLSKKSISGIEPVAGPDGRRGAPTFESTGVPAVGGPASASTRSSFTERPARRTTRAAAKRARRSAAPTVKAEGINEKYNIHGFPTMVIVDQQGIVRDVHVGYSKDLRKDVGKKIDQLLAKTGT